MTHGVVFVVERELGLAGRLEVLAECRAQLALYLRNFGEPEDDENIDKTKNRASHKLKEINSRKSTSNRLVHWKLKYTLQTGQ